MMSVYVPVWLHRLLWSEQGRMQEKGREVTILVVTSGVALVNILIVHDLQQRLSKIGLAMPILDWSKC